MFILKLVQNVGPNMTDMTEKYYGYKYGEEIALEKNSTYRKNDNMFRIKWPEIGQLRNIIIQNQEKIFQ